MKRNAARAGKSGTIGTVSNQQSQLDTEAYWQGFASRFPGVDGPAIFAEVSQRLRGQGLRDAALAIGATVQLERAASCMIALRDAPQSVEIMLGLLMTMPDPAAVARSLGGSMLRWLDECSGEEFSETFLPPPVQRLNRVVMSQPDPERVASVLIGAVEGCRDPEPHTLRLVGDWSDLRPSA